MPHTTYSLMWRGEPLAGPVGVLIGPIFQEVFTKRKALSMLSSFYDPRGLICAFIITINIMRMELCQYE